MKVLTNGATVNIKSIFKTRPGEYDGTTESINNIITYSNKLMDLANTGQGLARTAREVCNMLKDDPGVKSQLLFHLLDEALEKYEARLIVPEGEVC